MVLQRVYVPVPFPFIIKAISFFGNSIGDRTHRDSEDIEGDLKTQYKEGMAFLLRNLKKTQQGQPFNSLGILEVSQVALEELLQNAIIHRDYFKNAPIRMFIFDNRIEMISPGKLPNSLTVENSKYGNSAMRNAHKDSDIDLAPKLYFNPLRLL